MKYLAASILFISACSQANNSQAIEICDTSLPHKLLTNDSYNIHIYYPELNKEVPKVWEGPICTQHKQSKKYVTLKSL